MRSSLTDKIKKMKKEFMLYIRNAGDAKAALSANFGFENA
jgi:hypothetical protein